MDTKTRLLAKATTWQVSGLISMALIGYVFTGSFTTGGGIAVAGAMLGFASYFVHEWLWSNVRWGRVDRNIR